MKSTITKFLIILSIFAYSSAALSAIIPGYKRPLYTVDVNIKGQSGVLANLESLEITHYQTDVIGNEVSKQGFILELDSELRELEVISVEDDGCGSKVYTAIEADRADDNFRLELVNHSTRICKDLPPALVELELHYQGFVLGGSLNGLGFPEQAITITSF